MKKTMLLLLVMAFSLMPVGISEAPAQADYRFLSLEWGCDWESAAQSQALIGMEPDIQQSPGRILVKLQEIEYLGIPVSAALVFDSAENSQTPGLVSAMAAFQDADEESLLSKLIEEYGEISEFYLDENGVANPISPAGWVSPETLSQALPEAETQALQNAYSDSVGRTRMDAVLRSPLVIIRFSAENNLLEFSGSTAAFVNFLMGAQEER